MRRQGGRFPSYAATNVFTFFRVRVLLVGVALPAVFASQAVA